MRCQHEASVRAHSRRAFTGGSLSWALHRPPSLPQPPPSTVCCLPVRPPNAPSCLPPIPLPPPYIAGWRRERKRAGDPIPSFPLSLPAPLVLQKNGDQRRRCWRRPCGRRQRRRIIGTRHGCPQVKLSLRRRRLLCLSFFHFRDASSWFRIDWI